MVMKSRKIKTAAGIMLAAMGMFSAAQAMAGEYIVKFKDNDDAAHYAAIGTLDGIINHALVVDSHVPAGLVKINLGNLSGKPLAQQLANLMERSDVQYVVEDFKIKMLSMPNDPQISQQWSVAKVRAAEAWDIGIGSRQVTVAVIDTGVDMKHSDLAANIWKNSGETANGKDDDGNGLVDDMNGWDFKDNDKDPSDVTSSQNPGHGTHCAGIIGAVGDNGIGISGMSQQVSIMPLRFIGPDGSGDLMGGIKAIDYAIAKKADIISASWGAAVSASQAQPLIEAVGRANDAGVIFVAAAANDGKNNDTTEMYPANAAFPNMITVAASDNNDAKPSWSNFGKAKVALASPGLNIFSTLPAEKFGNLSGTSMATPLVAGLVALLKSQKNLNASEARSLLQSTGAKVAIETACMCRVDAAAAMQALKNNSLQVVPAAGTFAVGSTLKASAFGGAGGYQFASSNPGVLEVANDGTLSAKAEGDATLKVTDSAGASMSSLNLHVGKSSGGGGGDNPPPSGECPLGDPMLCAIMCQIQPTLPWCN